MFYTYQDLVASGDNKESFIMKAILNHKTSKEYQTAVEADLYARQMNPTIMKYQKLLYTISGKAVPDNFSANHKCCSNFFNRFITQQNQYLLGNGVQFEKEDTKKRLGGDRFDGQLQKAGIEALIAGVSFGFFNLNKVEVFKLTEFVPLWDEEDGSLKAGIRFWQLDVNKPLRATLYEMDGYTSYIKRSDDGNLVVFKPKRDYKQIVKSSVADGVEIMNYGNYPSFPIVPLWGNKYKQSTIIGLKGQIDAYDLIKSGFANDLDDTSMIYWTINNAGGMDDIDLAKFIEHMKVVKAAVIDEDGASAESHTIEIPYMSRESYLKRLEGDLYNDAMALNVQHISAGNITATAVNAAYEPLNSKTDEYEFCVIEFINGLLDLIGVEDSPTFKRSKISNMSEETSTILQASEYLDTETILKHLPFLSPDEVNDIMNRLVKEEAQKVEEEQADEEEDTESKVL